MCSHPLSPSSSFFTDSVEDELELSAVRHRPEGLEQLEAQTRFSRKELQILYRGFKNVSEWATMHNVQHSALCSLLDINAETQNSFHLFSFITFCVRKAWYSLYRFPSV